ncbi:hypothetical protein GCAAIG_00095 [Candidatus Electronema halotolerans]
MKKSKCKCLIGLTALGLSLLALLLAVFPSCYIQQNILNIEPICHDERAPFSFNLERCGQQLICPTEAEQCAADIRQLDWHLRLSNILMILAAAAAISTALYAWRKEQAKEFCLFSIVASLLALSWQHVNALLSVSMALLLFMILTARSRLS